MVVVTAFSFHLNAQDPSYKGPAKIYVASFWKNVESLKNGAGGSAQNLERAIANTKEKDPSYNTSAMEAELKIWKEKESQSDLAKQEKKDSQAKKMADQHNAQWETVNLKKDLDYLFKEANLQVGHNNLEFAQKRLDDFKSKTQNVLSQSAKVPQDYVKYISKFNGSMEQFYSRNKALLADVTKVEEYEPAHFELQLYEAYWDAAQKIYPNETEFKDAYAKIVAYKKSVGTLNDVKKVSDKNSIEKIKDAKMDAPVAKDATLEKFVLDAFNATFKNDYGTALKVVLTQNGWTTEKNELTGITTGRNRTTQVAYKGNDGKCYLLSGIVYIHEEYVSGNFTNRVIVYKGIGGMEMLCENVK